MGLFKKKASKASIGSEAKSFRKGSTTSVGSSVKSPTSLTSKYNGSYAAMPTIISTQLPPAPDPAMDPAAYLRSIYAVRERNKFVIENALQNKLTNFNVDLEKLQDVVDYVAMIIKRDYGQDFSEIPPHGRWQHFEVGGRKRVDELLRSWIDVDVQEKTRRLLDLFLVSVLLDAGAGNVWCYKSRETGKVYRRSEGLAVASLEMFKEGLFSSNPSNKEQVDGPGLKNLTVERLARGLQISTSNPIDGLEGRAGLLIKLADALTNQQYFGNDARPGAMIDFLLAHKDTDRSSGLTVVCVPTLWNLLMDGLAPIWPESRTQVDGISLGDAWSCSSMPPIPGWERIVPFHKLTQWLAYSLMVPMTKLMGIQWAGEELLTGLPEYRNGGLLIDLGLITLKEPQMKRGLENYATNAKIAGQPNVEVVPMFTPDDDVIVEWRSTTLGFLDILLVEVNKTLGLSGDEELTLAQMLEAGTWKGGRELAEVSRPNTKEPPIMLLSDGTVF